MTDFPNVVSPEEFQVLPDNPSERRSFKYSVEKFVPPA